MIRIILNGKKAGLETVRSAISLLREEVEGVEVRVTYEYGDVKRFVDEAIRDNVTRLVIGGGDGSVNEVVNALAKYPRAQRLQLAILPLGTANDFSTACTIPMNSLEALRLAVSGKTMPIDIAKANEEYFINMATAGFGAKVTAETPVELKNFLGGGAYTLVGVLKALHFTPYMAPKAYINDGLLDVLIIKEVFKADISQLLEEVKNPNREGEYVKYFQTTWLESESEEVIPVNLDGEPYANTKIRFEVVPAAIDLVLPENCPCLK
ncbi:MAG TPA: YegS/Rv2252/BmrU family lipid kinase [Sulfurovum sp.]|nr:YegS/Rv2252/BmrU family lipid kinase [Sulfurovum sp.]